MPLPFVYARVERDRRLSQVYVAASVRLFSFDFWANGVALAQGRTDDILQAVRAMDAWVNSDCSTTELAAKFEFVTVDPHATYFEAGTEVDHRWNEYLARNTHGHMTPFLQAAAKLAPLRSLFPFTSMSTLCFSRCTGYPYTSDAPSVRMLNNGMYGVFEHERLLAEGSAEEMASFLAAHLPPNCGPAVAGTADELTNDR